MMHLKSAVVISAVMISAAGWSYERAKNVEELGGFEPQPIKSAPPCIRLYDHLKTYSERYDVPFHIAVGVASKETSYGGPFHWTYEPALTSSANAYGAMQVQAPTASDVWKRKVTKKELLTDLEFNVHTSMKLLSQLHKRYGSWAVALGCYNTGRPIVNDYARKILSRKSV
jgi:soluble lytic murein transglycosylase-like protein